MRLGVFGGSFDPVHNGHLLLAEQCREQCQLDEVCFIPARVPPHKPVTALTAGHHRLEMLRCAVAGSPCFTISDLELKRDQVSWTVQTLQLLSEQRPDDDLFCCWAPIRSKIFQSGASRNASPN